MHFDFMRLKLFLNQRLKAGVGIHLLMTSNHTIFSRFNNFQNKFEIKNSENLFNDQFHTGYGLG